MNHCKMIVPPGYTVKRSKTIGKKYLVKDKWEVLRTGQGWVHLVEADSHLKDLSHCPASLTLHETGDKKLVLRQKLHGVCTLCEFQKNEHDLFHLKRVSLVRRV